MALLYLVPNVILKLDNDIYVFTQGDIHFRHSNGLRTVDRSIIYQYQLTDTPESTPCSSHIPQSREILSAPNMSPLQAHPSI